MALEASSAELALVSDHREWKCHDHDQSNRRNRRAGGRTRPRGDAGRADGRARSHRGRARASFAYHAPDRQQSPGAPDLGGPARVQKQGRHRYHRLATPAVARMLEGIMQVAAVELPRPARAIVVGPRDAAMRLARSCYDHLAGRLGVAIAESLVDRHAIEFEDDVGQLTCQGERFLANLGIAIAEPKARDPAPDAASLPALPGLERASRPCRRAGGGRDVQPQLRRRLGAAACRHARAGGHAQGPPGFRQVFRVRPRALAPLPRCGRGAGPC